LETAIPCSHHAFPYLLAFDLAPLTWDSLLTFCSCSWFSSCELPRWSKGFSGCSPRNLYTSVT
jgi:hypothetical protein